MRLLSLLVTGSLFLFSATIVRGDIDPCPARQNDFRNAGATARAAWQKINLDVGGLQFNQKRFQAQLRTELEKQATQDIRDTIVAVNAGRGADKQLHISDLSLQAAAKKKIDLMLARPETKSYIEQVTRQAEDTFIQEKAKKQLELANSKKQLDDQIDAEKKKLDANCSYDFPSQFVRIISQVLQIDVRVEGGMITIGDFKTLIPVFNAGKVMLGDHYLMDVPVVKDGQISVGGTSVGILPEIASGGILLPATAVAKALKIDLPKIDVPVKIGGGNDGHGLDVQVGNWKF
jgi:hypothetical protein